MFCGVIPEGVPDYFSATDIPFVCWDSNAPPIPPCKQQRQLAVSNVRISPGLFEWLAQSGITTIVSTMGFRTTIPGWSRRITRCAHSEFGGVTEGNYLLYIASTSDSVDVAARLPSVVARDMGTILSYGTSVANRMKAPASTIVEPLQAINLGSSLLPVYHGKGLLPARPTLNTHICTPAKGCRTGFWGVRGLTSTKLAQAYDVGDAHHILVPAFSPHFTPLGILRGFLLGYANDVPKPEKVREHDKSQSRRLETLPALGEDKIQVSSHFGSKRPASVDTQQLTVDCKRAKSALTLVDSSCDLGADTPLVPLVKVSDPISKEARERKATKSDDAPVPEELWMEHLIHDGPSSWTEYQIKNLTQAVRTTHVFLLRYWKRRIRKEFCCWYNRHHASRSAKADMWSSERKDVEWNEDLGKYGWREGKLGQNIFRTWYAKKFGDCKDFQAGRDCLYRAVSSSWWAWDQGSRPFFWRWDNSIQEEIRDGMRICFVGNKPKYLEPQAKHIDPASKKLVEEKLQKVIDRGYLENREVITSLTSFFHVKKGDDDIRMVYDGTKCGLNEALWVPTFFMPTMGSHLRAVVEGTHMCNVDIGDCFLNFMLHPTLRALCGVDLGPYDLDFSQVDTPMSSTKTGLKKWLAWCRAAMGLKPSPYQAVRTLHFLEERIRGNPSDPSNVFRWDYVRCNFPGQEDYDPSIPWVSKVKILEDGSVCIAADLFAFVDDLRSTGMTREEAWKAGRRAASIINWLGCQDAPRKRRASRQDPGAWAGCVLRTKGGVFALVSEDKWLKFKTQINELSEFLETSPESIPRKRLEQIRGFMNYVVQTYRPLIPYLNGLHMTIDGWRPGRDEEGWRLPNSSQRKGEEKLPDELAGFDILEGPISEAVPLFVSAVPRLMEDVAALQTLCAASTPPWRRVRPKTSASVMYGFGDASGAAFGASSQFQGDDMIHVEYGQWISSATEEESSNWREFTNLVEYLEGRGEGGMLTDSEVFMFTDNSTAEAAFWKGSSKSRKLCDLVLRLRLLEMNTGMILHVVHVSGKRMIAQGTDGLSRGDHSAGIMTGKNIRYFIPLHLPAVSRSARLEPWLSDILAGCDANLLTPDGWYADTNKEGTFIWSPAPAAGDVVVERLGIARHKRPNTLHVILIPRLMTGRWRKRLLKSVDFYCHLTCPSIWNMQEQFEPLLMFVALPFLPHEPRKFIPSPRGVFCANFSVKRGIFAECRQGWCGPCYKASPLVKFPVKVVLDDDGNIIQREEDEKRFMEARDGDHLMTPFQCDLCHFRNIQGRDPLALHGPDQLLLAFVRRANLDAFWKSEPNTVYGNLLSIRRVLKTQATFGMKGLLPAVGPFPLEDSLGMREAVAVLDKSLDKGRYAANVQWATFRQIRSALTNFHQSTAGGMGDRVGAYERSKTWISQAKTATFFCTRFMEGIHKRVGETVLRDEPITIGMVKALDNLLETQWNRVIHQEGPSSHKLHQIARKGVWFISAWCAALRGEEHLILEYAGTRASLKNIINPAEGTAPHFELVISGRTKNHRLSGGKFSIPVVALTERSNLRPGVWIARLCSVLAAVGRTKGFLFGTSDEDSPKLADFHDMFYGTLEELQMARPDLIPEEVVVTDVFGLYRSGRRGVSAHATNIGVPTAIMNAVSRWRVERNSDVPVLSMAEVYSRLDSIKPTVLRYSQPM